ncbi:Dynein heavy chain 6, axonemal [Bulinus truncatus]|nr:Dynein heavy chain 6, axonemal [Bulinus truncatus]
MTSASHLTQGRRAAIFDPNPRDRRAAIFDPNPRNRRAAIFDINPRDRHAAIFDHNPRDRGAAIFDHNPRDRRAAIFDPNPRDRHAAIFDPNPRNRRAAIFDINPRDRHAAIFDHNPRDRGAAIFDHNPRDRRAAIFDPNPRDRRAAIFDPNPRDRRAAIFDPNPRDRRAAIFDPNPRDRRAAIFDPNPRDRHAATFDPNPRDRRAAIFDPNPRDRRAATFDPNPRDRHAATFDPNPRDRHAATFDPNPGTGVLLSLTLTPLDRRGAIFDPIPPGHGGVLKNIEKSFSTADKYASTVDKHREFYAKDIVFDLNQVRPLKNSIAQSDPGLFTDLIVKFHQQHRMAMAIPDRLPLGFLLIDAQMLKKTLIPAPIECLKQIHKFLPVIAKKAMDDILLTLQDGAVKLQNQPTSTMEYVAYLQFMDDFQQQIDSMELKSIIVKDLYTLIDEFMIGKAPEDAVVYSTMEPIIYNSKNLIDRALSGRDTIVERFNKCAEKDGQEYLAEARDVFEKMQNPMLLDPKANREEIRQYVNDLLEQMELVQQKAKTLKDRQKELKVEVTKLDYLHEVQTELKMRDVMWRCIDEWDNIVLRWIETPFMSLEPEEVTATTMKYLKTVQTLEKGLPSNEVVSMLKKKVEVMRQRLQVITDMRNPHLKKRHWDLIQEALNYKFIKDEPLTLGLLIEIDAFDKADVMMEISGMASSQAALEAILKKVVDSWKHVEFPVLLYKDQKDVYILGGTDEIQQLLDDSNINIQTVQSSRHVGPIKTKVDEWAASLSLFNKTLESWVTCQRTWLYLESIFSAPDIQRQLPVEAKLFIEVDRSYKEIMRRVKKTPLAIRNGTQPGLWETFEYNNELLDKILKCLEAYLETKRVAFPRFYFLSNDELLEILAQTRNPLAVQPHLRKCFDAIHRLEFGIVEGLPLEEEIQYTNDILSMISPEGEKIGLGKGLKARGNVEDWLSKVEEAMFASIRRLCKKSIKEYETMSFLTWIMSNASQVSQGLQRKILPWRGE